MKYGSVCSGIEAATVAWHPLGWTPEWFSEIEPFPNAVLQHHYPDVPNYGDMIKFKEWKDAQAIDLLVGGTPCQSFSIAGLRKGLMDPRGNLMLTYLAMVEHFRPCWLVWENVPGVLSSNKGRDFGSFLGGLGKLGYGWAYRVLDAQYFGVAQRRRRVFVVGYLGDWRRAAQVLFERESLSGDSAPRREKGEEITHDVARCIRSRGPGTERIGNTKGQDNVVAMCLNAGGMGRQDAESETLVTHALQARHDGSEDGTGRGVPLCVPLDLRNAGRDPEKKDRQNRQGCGVGENGDPSSTISTAFVPGVAMTFKIRQGCEGGGKGFLGSEDKAMTVATHQDQDLFHNGGVRRLTPRECERLQGFPDDYTAITIKGKPAADGPRYRALGNSMAVPVMRWIGQRIQEVLT